MDSKITLFRFSWSYIFHSLFVFCFFCFWHYLFTFSGALILHFANYNLFCIHIHCDLWHEISVFVLFVWFRMFADPTIMGRNILSKNGGFGSLFLFVLLVVSITRVIATLEVPTPHFAISFSYFCWKEIEQNKRNDEQ